MPTANFVITEEQETSLARAATETKRNKSSIVREGLDMVLSKLNASLQPKKKARK